MLEFLDRLDQLDRRIDRALKPRSAPSTASNRLTELALGDFIPEISPRWERPDHLAQLLDVFERIKRGEVVRVLLSVPPQHGKTETELHGIAQLLAIDPRKTHAFTSYAAQYAESKSRLARDYALRAGVKLRGDSTAVHEWRTADGGGLLATGVGGPLTGQGVDGVILVDDPFKNRAEAESQLIRDRVFEWFTSAAMTRAHPSTSVIVVHTRWHPDDLIGRLCKEVDESGKPLWEHINLPAVSEKGEALWPKHRPLPFLEAARRRSEYDWWSMFMGVPRSRGAGIFRDVYYYDVLPPTYRVGVGVDLAYTSKTHSDWCVAVALAESQGNFYALDVRREQSNPPTFAAQLRVMKAAYPGARMLWYTSTTERGLADLLRSESGFPLVGELATADKFVRAQPVAAAWNAGKIFLPRSAPWLVDFISEVCGFTGVNDRHDDQVDALAAAFDVLTRGAGLGNVRTFPSKFEAFGGNPFKPAQPGKW
jgi:predicted phage terminase large subunit-like protein